MEDHLMDEEKAKFLLHIGRPLEAAEIYLTDDQNALAVVTLWETDIPEHRARASRILLDELWKAFPMKCLVELSEQDETLLSMTREMTHAETADEVSAMNEQPIASLKGSRQLCLINVWLLHFWKRWRSATKLPA